jgi:very-short-patch-repair endonuclease
LPVARRQAQRVLTSGVRYLDNFYDAYRLCVELDGRSSHPPEQKWQDADRDNDNLFAGDVQTVRFGVRDVTVRRCARAAARSDAARLGRCRLACVRCGLSGNGT